MVDDPRRVFLHAAWLELTELSPSLIAIVLAYRHYTKFKRTRTCFLALFDALHALPPPESYDGGTVQRYVTVVSAGGGGVPYELTESPATHMDVAYDLMDKLSGGGRPWYSFTEPRVRDAGAALMRVFEPMIADAANARGTPDVVCYSIGGWRNGFDMYIASRCGFVELAQRGLHFARRTPVPEAQRSPLPSFPPTEAEKNAMKASDWGANERELLKECDDEDMTLRIRFSLI